MAVTHGEVQGELAPGCGLAQHSLTSICLVQGYLDLQQMCSPALGTGFFLSLDEMARSCPGNSYCMLAAVSIAGLALAGFRIS